MPNIKTVIYPLHYNLHLVDAAASDTTNRLNSMVFKYYRYMNVNKMESPLQLVYRSALFSGYFNISNCVETAPCMPLGYLRWDTSCYDNNKEWTYGNPPLQHDTSECIKLLNELVEICQKYKVRLIVYTPPFSDDYIAEMTDEGRANLQKIAHSVNKNHPIEYHDYTDDKDYRDPSLYFNWNHLNHKGATLFTKRIRRDFQL